MIDDILKQAVDQAMNGKGKRHGGSSVPWLEQPWKVYTDMFGEGFLKGQAVKKMEEAVSTRTGDSFKHEMLGAIVYMMAVISKAQNVDLHLIPEVLIGIENDVLVSHTLRMYGWKVLVFQSTMLIHVNDIPNAIYFAARAIMEVENETNQSR